MNKNVLEKMDKILAADNQYFDVMMTELILLIENLDCPYIQGFFWATKIMMGSKDTIEEKKIILKIYRDIYFTLE
ncbi:MAG: hypothetical protein PHH12_00100 [Candidatus Shapirobacteria bacterium]|nr:hypothetical protein [Candidatus Shapirobacteria bacterium]